MPDERDTIRGRVDLVDLAGERVKLVRVGKKWKGLCPFHTEKTPSFYVDADLQLFHCFGCKKGGDIFDWVMLTENVDFRAALELLAERAGVVLSRGKGPREEVENSRQIMEEACAFFRHSFAASAEARAYVSARGLDEHTINLWEVGYALAEDHALANKLRQAGFKLQDAKLNSLVSGDQSAGYSDFFRNRLMFPIRDEGGHLIAFSGRTMDGSEPKYINSRDTALFRKSDTLYGLFQSRQILRDTRQAIIAEGQMDVIALHRAGLGSAVAALGTALTSGHAAKLKRYADSVVIVYDGDVAGRKAAERALAVLQSAGLECKVCLLQPSQDPDQILSKDGAEALRQIVTGATRPLKFIIAGLIREFDAQPGIKEQRFWNAAKNAVAASADLLEADEVLAELAALHPNARIDQKATVNALRAEVETLRKPKQKKQVAVAVVWHEELPLPRGPEREIIRAAISDEHRAGIWPRLAEDDLIVSEGGRALADGLLAAFSEAPDLTPRELAAALPNHLQQMIFRLESPPDPNFDSDPPLSPEGVVEAVERLEQEKKRRLRHQKFQSSPSIETALEIYPSSS